MINNATSPGFNSQSLVTHYEDLRALVLKGIGRGLGLALFLRQGMKAWMQACSQWSPQVSRDTTSNLALHYELPLDSRDQLVMILAGMALNGYWEARQ
jgi:hypothetical protein